MTSGLFSSKSNHEQFPRDRETRAGSAEKVGVTSSKSERTVKTEASKRLDPKESAFFDWRAAEKQRERSCWR